MAARNQRPQQGETEKTGARLWRCRRFASMVHRWSRSPGMGNQQFFPQLVNLWQQLGAVHARSLLSRHHHQINRRQVMTHAAKRLSDKALEPIALNRSLGHLFGDSQTKSGVT